MAEPKLSDYVNGYKFSNGSDFYEADPDTYMKQSGGSMSFDEAMVNQDQITGNLNRLKFGEVASGLEGVEVSYNPFAKSLSDQGDFGRFQSAKVWKPTSSGSGLGGDGFNVIPKTHPGSNGKNFISNSVTWVEDKFTPNGIKAGTPVKQADNTYKTEGYFYNTDSSMRDFNNAANYNKAYNLTGDKALSNKDFALGVQNENQSTANTIGLAQAGLGAASLVGNMWVANENRKIKEDALDYQKEQDVAATAKTDKFQRRLGGL